MSFCNAPDARTLGLVAGAVDEAFVEKDWFVVQAIRVLESLRTADIVPVFSGGTSLLKGHGLIKRFPEDIDFKLSLSEAFQTLSGNQRRNALGAFRDSLFAAWTEAGFTITDVTARGGNGFICIEMTYPSRTPTAIGAIAGNVCLGARRANSQAEAGQLAVPHIVSLIGSLAAIDHSLGQDDFEGFGHVLLRPE